MSGLPQQPPRCTSSPYDPDDRTVMSRRRDLRRGVMLRLALVLAERACDMGLVDSVALQGYFLSLSLVTNKPRFSKHWSAGAS